jgi:gluconokinase
MVILVMGVVGSGKTTVGKLLAQKLGWTFLEADDYHSPANRQKMHLGIPLTDPDRLPWLTAIHDEMLLHESRGQNTVVACSALKQTYRELLCANLPIKLVYLRVTPEQLHRHLAARAHHFAGESLVPSQLATLEEPSEALIEDVSHTPEEIVQNILAHLDA